MLAAFIVECINPCEHEIDDEPIQYATDGYYAYTVDTDDVEEANAYHRAAHMGWGSEVIETAYDQLTWTPMSKDHPWFNPDNHYTRQDIIDGFARFVRWKLDFQSPGVAVMQGTFNTATAITA